LWREFFQLGVEALNVTKPVGSQISGEDHDPQWRLVTDGVIIVIGEQRLYALVAGRLGQDNLSALRRVYCGIGHKVRPFSANPPLCPLSIR
jgi:hypothetical protein